MAFFRFGYEGDACHCIGFEGDPAVLTVAGCKVLGCVTDHGAAIIEEILGGCIYKTIFNLIDCLVACIVGNGYIVMV